MSVQHCCKRRWCRWEDPHLTLIYGQGGDSGGFEATCKSSATCCVPGHRSTPSTRPHSSGLGCPKRLKVFALLFQGLHHLCSRWKKPAGQGSAGLRNGATVTAAKRGSSFASRCPQLPPPPRVAASCSFLSCGQQELRGGGVGCRGVSRARSVPPGPLLAHAARVIPQSKALTLCWPWGRWRGTGRGRSAAAGRTNTEPVFSGASTAALVERKAALCS